MRISDVVVPVTFLLASCFVAAAQERGTAQPPPSRADRVAIKAGRLIDLRTGKIETDVYVIVADGRILSVGGETPTGIRVIDLSGTTVLPGLIDCHAHVLGNLKDESAFASLRMSSAQGALWGVHNVQTWLDHGFTSLREAGEPDPYYGQLALRDSIRLGLVMGPRMVSSGGFVSVSGGHGDADVLAPDQSLARRPNLADTVDDVGSAVRRDIKYGADWIKVMATGGTGDPRSDYNVEELSEAQLSRAVEIAHRAGKHVMAHAEGTAGIKAAVRAGVDSIEHGTMLDEEGATLMEQRKTWLVPTLYAFQHIVDLGTSMGQEQVSYEKAKAILQYQGPAFSLALKHHLRIAFGLDEDPDVLPKEFQSLVKGGMRPLDALRAATINAAELIGMEKEIGAIEPGKFADIIAVKGDPLEDIAVMEHVVFVMKGGEMVSNQISGK